MRLDPQVRDPIHFRLVDRIDLHPRGNVHPIDEGEPIAGLPHGTGGHHPDPIRAGDPILLQDLAVAPEHPHALLDRRLANARVGKRVLSQTDRLRERFQRADVPVRINLANRHPD